MSRLVLLGRWSWKRLFISDPREHCCAHSLFGSPWRQKLQVDSFTQKMVLKRPSIVDTVVRTLLCILCPGLHGD